MLASGTSKGQVSDEIWIKLRKGLDAAFRRENMTSQQYMEYYSSVYLYCTKAAFEPVPRPATATTNRLKSESAGFVGHALYEKVEKYVKDHATGILKEIQVKQGEALLAIFTEEWVKFKISARVMDGMFSYLNRHWIKRELDEARGNVHVIYTLGSVIWSETVLFHVEGRILDEVLELIRQQRNGDIIDDKYISGVLDCLVELGNDEYEPKFDSHTARRVVKKDRLRFYKSFEQAFLTRTKEYYSKEADNFVEQQGCVSDYMTKVMKRLDEEELRCQLYLDPSTREEMMTMCEEILVLTKLELFQDQFHLLLLDCRNEDLKMMFTLCVKVKNGLVKMRKMLEVHIEKEGQEALKKLATDESVDAKEYVEMLIDVHQRYERLVKTSFSMDPGFVQSLDKACTTFVNVNAVTKKFRSDLNKSAEFLARYCDQLLRKSSRMLDDDEMEATLDRIITVFKYLDDKDAFLKYYSRMFSKRLIVKSSSSDEAEVYFINKLKHICGHEYTGKLSKMINDTRVSKDLATEFEEMMAAEMKENIGLGFDVVVLSTGFWPTFSDFAINIPVGLSEGVDEYRTFYGQKFKGRRLTWIHSQARGEVATFCYQKNYQFVATTAQIATMLLFNEQDSLSMGEIVEATGMDARNAESTVESLVENRVLRCDKENQDDSIPSDAILSLNMNFANRKLRVDLSRLAMKIDGNQENEIVRRNVEYDRKSVISACVVRILKGLKQISHQELVKEVVQQLSARFTPDSQQICRCIGSLIEQEYMLKLKDTKDVYEYLA